MKPSTISESFFFSRYRATGNQPGEVGLAPVHLGSVRQIDVAPGVAWVCTGGSYLASGPGLQIDTEFQGLKGLFTGESISFVKVSGQGPLLVGAFGRLVQHQVDGELTVDTGHVVAFTDGLTYTLDKVGGSWIQSWLAGEGIVLKFSGKGTLLAQSHNPNEFGKLLGPKLPQR